MAVLEVLVVIVERTLTLGLLFGVPWVLAMRLLRQRTGLDWPGRLVAVSVAALPEDRREWGSAMTAELDQLVSRSERWWFALGALRVALVPPARGDRRLLLLVAVAALGAAGAARLVAVREVPGLDLFVPAVVAGVGLAVAAAVARSSRAPWRRSGLLLGTLVPAAVVGAVGSAIWFARAHPTVEQATNPLVEAAVAAVLAVVAAVALAPPAALAPSTLAARLVAVGGLALAGLLVLAARGPDATVEVAGTLAFLGAPLVAGLIAAVVATADRSFRSGLVAATWTLLLAVPLTFAVWLPSAAAVYDTRGLLLDNEVSAPIGTNFPDIAFALFLMTLLALPSSLIGAAVGTRHRTDSTGLLSSPYGD